MKHVLIVDNSSLFREYLRRKLEDNGVEVTALVNPLEAVSKMRSIAPDLIILDSDMEHHAFMELLKQKKNDINSSNAPIIIMAKSIEQKQLIELVPYNVKKVFTKPIKIDTLFVNLSEILGIPFDIDESPGIMEVHVNDNIIFIQIAQGLNRDKLEVLRFKIRELMGIYKIRVPKVIIMLSGIELSSAEAPRILKLLDYVHKSSQAKLSNIRMLTNDEFTRKLISESKDYSDIKVVSNLQFAMSGLLSDRGKGAGPPEHDAELISDKILHAEARRGREEMLLKFDAEARSNSFDFVRSSMQDFRIAVIDDDFVVHELIKSIFNKTGATINSFYDGEEFLIAIDAWDFDLAFLDINMPIVNGFDVLRALQARDIKYPVIVLSAVSQQEAIIKAIQMGVNSYLVKPLKPEDIFKKSVEILKANF